jgi:hypothetical protein
MFFPSNRAKHLHMQERAAFARATGVTKINIDFEPAGKGVASNDATRYFRR